MISEEPMFSIRFDVEALVACSASRVEVAEDVLLGEVLVADRDRRLARCPAGRLLVLARSWSSICSSFRTRPARLPAPRRVPPRRGSSARSARELLVGFSCMCSASWWFSLSVRNIWIRAVALTASAIASVCARSSRTPRGVSRALQERQRPLDGERQRRHADGRAEHAGEVVARLVGDDVAERPAEAGQRGDRGRRDHEQGGRRGCRRRSAAPPAAARRGAGSPSSVMPMPRAASTRSGSTSSTPR